MKTIHVISLSIVLTLVMGCSNASKTTSNHIRWDIKTLQDIDTAWFTSGGLYPAEATTVSKLNAMAAPAELTKRAARQEKEKVLVVVGGWLHKVKKEEDGDWHLTIKDESGDETLIAEVPDPRANDVCDSRFAWYFKAVRKWIDDSLSTRIPKEGYHVMITGVRHFDTGHDEQIEVHPVLGIRWAQH